MSGITSASSDNGIAGGANSGNGLWINIWTDNFYLNGTTNDGTNVVGTMSSPFLVSFSKNSTVSVTGYQVGADRNINGRGWKGVFGEVIAFNAKLTDANRQKIEGYLAHKWGLSANLATSHSYSAGPPMSATGSPNYIDANETQFASGKAIDLVNGHVCLLYTSDAADE